MAEERLCLVPYSLARVVVDVDKHRLPIAGNSVHVNRKTVVLTRYVALVGTFQQNRLIVGTVSVFKFVSIKTRR